MLIVFGYKDARPARFVGDRYERLQLVERIQMPCRAGRFDCGFARSPDDADLFEKRLRGPDGGIRQIHLRVLASSADPDDEENRRDPFQRWKSERARHAFLSGLAQADLVFYDGHSRNGGGPDFSPPRLSKSRHVDYAWYEAHTPGLSAMKAALRGKDRPAKIVGLFSCDSDRLSPPPDSGRRTLWITTPQLYYFADALSDMLDALSAELDGKCGGE